MKAWFPTLVLVTFASHLMFAAAPALSLGNKADVVQAAQRLNAFAWIEKPAPKSISFFVPAGPVISRAGRGILLKNTSTTGRDGSTWSFEVGRKSPDAGVVVIHPYGNGHIVVHLRAEGVFLMPPNEFVKTPWQGGDALKLSGSVFPLQGKTYKVISQLSPAGRYALSIDGQVVATTSMTAGPQIALTREFHGEQLAPREEFPLKWHTGFSALIAGGADKGGNLGCSNITFQASAPEPVPAP